MKGKINFSIPESNWNEVLSMTSINDVFDAAKSDLSGVKGKRDTSVFKMIHKAKIFVDEKEVEQQL